MSHSSSSLSVKQDDKLKPLQARRKGLQQTFEDKMLIYSIMKQDNANNNQAMKNYQISRGTLLNIYKELNHNVSLWNTNKTRTRRQIQQSSLINVAIKLYTGLTKYSFSARDISSYLHQKYRARILSALVRDILRNNLGMSYKLWKSQPMSYCKSNTDLLKALFSLKVCKIIDRFELLINIDETMFSRSTKASYSWSTNGKEWTLINICY